MNSPKDKGARRRRTFYVDANLQGRLSLALVLLEVGLFVAASTYLYFALAGIIDNNLYVVHAAERQALLPQMLRELGLVVLVCAAANSVALLYTHRLWGRHVARVLGALNRRMERVRSLDLRPDPDAQRDQDAHRLLELCDRWVAAERERIVAINEVLDRLPKNDSTAYRPADALDVADALKQATEQFRHRQQRAP